MIAKLIVVYQGKITSGHKIFIQPISILYIFHQTKTKDVANLAGLGVSCGIFAKL